MCEGNWEVLHRAIEITCESEVCKGGWEVVDRAVKMLAKYKVGNGRREEIVNLIVKQGGEGDVCGGGWERVEVSDLDSRGGKSSSFLGCRNTNKY